MSQGAFNFKYVQSKNNSGQTAYAGLGVYFDLFKQLDFPELVNRTVNVSGDQGWSDWQHLLCLILLNLCGGDCIDDVSHLSNDEGLCRLVRHFEKSLHSTERKSLKKRFRKGRQGTFPSPSSQLRYLKRFHIASVSGESGVSGAYIPELSVGLSGLGLLNMELLGFMQANRQSKVATIDMDATLVESEKLGARMCYKGFKGYQPVNVYWHEQDMVLHSEFRDGNVPAGHDLKRVFEESLSHLPPGVNRVFLRSDSAGYKYDLLDYCHDETKANYGRIDFCVSSMSGGEFKKAVSGLAENAWQPIYKEVGSYKVESGQQWAEVDYVPSRRGFKVEAPLYRYLVVREKIRQPVLEEFDSDAAYDFPTAVCSGKRYRISGYVTNMDWHGEKLIHWTRKRCGQSEHIHSVMKNDFAGGKLPCAEFGANACWWLVMILSLNFHAIIKELVFDSSWRRRRMKAVRFGIINIAARVVNRSRQLHIVLSKGEAMAEVLIGWRRKILGLIPLPAG
jgi:hypothetical protein